MKKALLITMALVLIAIPAAAQQGYIGLFGDPNGENCFAFDTIPGLLNVYVVHMDSPGSSASQFAVDTSGAPYLTYLSDTSVFATTIGTSPAGVSIGYGGCLTSPIHILTLNFFATGISDPCSVLRVIEDPTVGAILSVDCELALVEVTGRGLFINPNENCENCGDIPVGTEQNTWGSLKSIFR